MSGKDRINMFPSRANHVQMKTRILSANKGLSLLKRKRDALEIKLREIVALRAGLAENFFDLFAGAIFSIAKANFLETDFKPALVIGSERADAFMRLTYAKTIGLLLPTFEPVIRKPESLLFTGLASGGRQVEVIRDKFQELLRTIILLASYDFSIRTLQDSIRSNNMRLNGLEFVVIPRFNNTLIYISQELDEMEREEFYRLKRSQGKQRALKEKAKKKPGSEGTTYVDAETWTGEEEEEPKKEEINVRLPLSILMKKKFASSVQTLITGHYPGSYEFISPTDSIVSGEIPTMSKRSSFRPFIAPLKTEKRVSVTPETDDLSAIAKKSFIAAPPPTMPPSNANVKPEPLSETNSSDTSTSPLVKTRSRLSLPANAEEAYKTENPNTSTTSGRTSATEPFPTEASSAVIAIKKLDEPSTSKPANVKVNEMGIQTEITGRYPRRSEMSSPQFDWIADGYAASSQTNIAGRHGRSSNTDHVDSIDSDHEDETKH